MFQKMLQGGSGGGESSKSIEVDTARILGSITTYNGHYTATEDCLLTGSMQSSSAYACYVTTERDNDSKSICYGTNARMGYGNNVGVYIPKGTELYTRNRNDGTYNLVFYGIKKI